MPLILAEELDTLTVEKIQEWDQRAGDATRIYIDIIDKCNLTSERLTRLLCLERERQALCEPHGVDADELNAKLRQISSRRSPTPSDTPSTPITTVEGMEITWESTVEWARMAAYKGHQNLKNIGGRPSREINPDPGPCPPWKSDVDKRHHDDDHWSGESGQMYDELTRWLDFRWHQFRMRENSKSFNRYKEAVHKYQEKKGIDWAVELQLDRQTKLDEWKEYYIYEHRKRRALENELGRAKKELEPAKERMRKAERNGSVGVPYSVWSKRAAEMIEYEEKMSNAQNEVEMTQKRLEVLRVEESLSTAEKHMLTTQAEEDLQSAQKRLEAQKLDEFEQLNKEEERTRAQAMLGICQGKVNYANTRLEQLDTQLEWIAGQFAEVATEYASSSWGSKYNRDLLGGWEKYYAYMRERLQATQDRYTRWRLHWGLTRERTDAEEVRDDLEFPQERVRPLKALLAWVEREFPEIAAQYAPFIQDGQSHDGHRDEADPPCSKLPPNEPVCKASRPEMRKNPPRQGRSARQQSPLSQVQPSKVSKPVQGRRRPLNERLSTTRHVVWLPEGHASDVGQVEGQKPPKVAVRRSKRISQQQLNTHSKRATLQWPSAGALDNTGQRRPAVENQPIATKEPRRSKRIAAQMPVERKRKSAASSTVEFKGRSRLTPRASSKPADGNRIRKRQCSSNGRTQVRRRLRS